MSTKIYWAAASLALVLNIATQAALVVMQLKVPERKEAQPLSPKQEWEYLISGWKIKCEAVELLEKTLKTGTAALEDQENQLNTLKTTLNAEKEELQALRKEIDRNRNELKDMIIEVEASEQKNLKAMAGTYAALAPQTVVSIFDHMDEDLVVKILHFMSDETVVPIFEAITKQETSKNGRRVAALSEKLRRLYQKEDKKDKEG